MSSEDVFVDETAYYDLLEYIAGSDDHGFPFRYAEILEADDVGTMGLAMKTAPTVEGALERLKRYIQVLSDTLVYRFEDAQGGRVFVLSGRPHHRRGAALSNECALGAIVSILRKTVDSPIFPVGVTFRHAGPPDDTHHRAFFGCPIRFEADVNGIELSHADLARPTLLADDGLSAYLMKQLDHLTVRLSQRSLVDEVRAAITNALPDGQPSRSVIARRLAMSERTLQRQLADHGVTFQGLTTDARRDAAKSLLTTTTHSLADVAFLTGFADQTSFTRAFKRWTEQTPASFRAAVA